MCSIYHVYIRGGDGGGGGQRRVHMVYKYGGRTHNPEVYKTCERGARVRLCARVWGIV